MAADEYDLIDCNTIYLSTWPERTDHGIPPRTQSPGTLGAIKQPHFKMNSELIKHAYNLAAIVKMEFNVSYNLEGIKAIEETINNERDFYENLPEKEKRHYSYKIGSFIGVSMIENLNGIWEENDTAVRKYIPLISSKVFPIENFCTSDTPIHKGLP